MRYEIKYDIENFKNQNQIFDLIKSHPVGFNQIFYTRRINNIYFDYENYSNYFENIEGEKQRKKYRIRWYGDTFGICQKPVFEIKTKIGPLGSKDKLDIKEFILTDRNKIYNQFDQLFYKEDENWFLIKSKILKPTLLNSYVRSYFASSDKNFRITVDKNVNFFNYSSNDFISQNSFTKYNSIIMEIKFDQKFYNQINLISNYFPFRISKSSKYVIGLQKFYN